MTDSLDTRSIIEQGQLNFTVAPKRQTIWGGREAFVFSLEGIGVGVFLAFMLAGQVTAMITGLGLLALAVLLLLSHLGHPSRAWMAIRNIRRSWISRGTVMIGFFLALGGLYVGSFLLPGSGAREALAPLPEVLLALAGLFILLYPGFAMATSPAIPFWNNGLMPILSLANGLASGGLILVAVAATTKASPLPAPLDTLVAGELLVLACLTLFLASYIAVMRRAGAAAQLSVQVLFNDNRGLFWGGVVIVGLAVPIVLVATNFSVSASDLWFGVAARLLGDVALRHGLLKAGVYDAVL